MAREGHYWALNEVKADADGVNLVFRGFSFDFASPRLDIAATTLAGAYQVGGGRGQRCCWAHADSADP